MDGRKEGRESYLGYVGYASAIKCPLLRIDGWKLLPRGKDTMYILPEAGDNSAPK